MNKPELMRAVSEKADISQTKAGLVIDAFTDAVTQTLAAGDTVSLVGFGTFEGHLEKLKQSLISQIK